MSFCREREGESAVRTVIICLLILALMFTGHSLYYRAQGDKLYRQALDELPGSATQAYNTIKPALDYNSVMMLGKVNEMGEGFLKSLEQTVARGLNDPIPTADSFINARQATDVLKMLGQQTGLKTQQAMLTITLAAKDAVPRLQAQGTLSAWDAMSKFFTNLNTTNQIPPNVFDNFGAWTAQLEAVPRRPLAVRDALQNASRSFVAGLNRLGLTDSPESGPYLLPMPSPLTDQQLIDAHKQFDQGLVDLDNFLKVFREAKLPEELLCIRAKLIYNKAALKLAHLQERGAALNNQGSGFMADLLIRTDTAVVPTASEMLGSFVGGAKLEFQAAQEIFQLATTVPEPMRRAYVALATWGEGMVVVTAGGGDSAAIFQRAEQCAAGAASGAAATITQAMRANARVTIIVQIP